MNLNKCFLALLTLFLGGCGLLDIIPSMPFNDPAVLTNPSDPMNVNNLTYTLSYHGNGNTGGEAPLGTIHKKGDSVTVASNMGNLVCTGCLFGGWNTEPDGKGINFTPGSSSLIIQGNMVLYARWLVWGTDYTSLSVGTLKYVPSGRFQRNAKASDVSVLTQGYRLSEREITRAQFIAVMGNDPSVLEVSGSLEDPVQNLSWYQAVAFCNKLSLAEGLNPVYGVNGVDFTALTWGAIPQVDSPAWNNPSVNMNANGYRLPTEMEWMWAAMGAPPEGQGGGTDVLGYTKTFSGSSGTNLLEDYVWYFGNSFGKSHPAGSKTPNELGLYDMSGNVFEWCWDWYGDQNVEPDYGVSGTLTDYRGPNAGTSRVVRGGGWDSGLPTAATAYRTYFNPSNHYYSFGLRVAQAAVEIQPRTYSLNYLSNGATGGSPPQGGIYTAGTAITVADNTGNMTREGAVFTGWYLSTNQEKVYTPGEVLVLGADTTLMPRWVDPNIRLRVHFQGNSLAVWETPYIYFWHSDGMVPIADPWPGLPMVREGGSWWTYEIIGATKAGIIFNQGLISGEQTVDLFRSSEGWFVPTGTDLTGKVEGLWSDANPDIPVYTLTYNSNGSTGGSVPAPTSQKAGTEVTVAANSGGLIKTDHNFVGWNTKADGSGTEYGAGTAVLTITDNITLYAHWEYVTPPIINYTVTYQANGATGGTVPLVGTYESGTTVTVAANTGGLVKTNYTFVGWNTQADGLGTNYSAGTGSFTLNSDLTLYAQWNIITYTVTYQANGATGGTVPPAATYDSGTSVTAAANTGSLVKTNYTFVGWNTQADGLGTNYYAGLGSFTLTGNLTLYARWNIITYTLTYQANGATGGTAPSAATFNTGTTVTVAYNSGYLAKTYYSFAGWNTQADGMGTNYTAGVGTFIISGNITLYAKWTLNTYNLSYNSNSATGGTVPTATVHNGGTTVTVAANSGSLVRSGYAFGGWNTLSDGTGTNYSASTGTFVIGQNTTLYAKWILAEDYSSGQIGLLKYVPAGKFQRDGNATSITVITKAYRISQQEVTRQQFLQMFSGTDPVFVGGQTAYSTGTSDPVMYVNWYHAMAYCNKLSLAEGLTQVYTVSGVNFSTLSFAAIPTTADPTWNAVTVNWNANGYRLPTEMEWMWAAMGAPSDGQGGGTNTTGYLKAFAGSTGSNPIYNFAWIWGNSGGKTNPVRTRQPNEIGLYDMSGNVMEWCWDRYGTYPSGTQTDYSGAASGSYRVTRGGSWDYDETFSTVIGRQYFLTELRNVNMGFRVVRQ